MTYSFDSVTLSSLGSIISNRSTLLLGQAGTGKTTLTKHIASTLASEPFTCIHLDNFFIGDSDYRKSLISNKTARGKDSSIDIKNQYSWWDWCSLHDVISSCPKPFLVEGAIPPLIVTLKLFDNILFYQIDETTRVQNLATRDNSKRSLEEIRQRTILTDYSEHIHYQWIFRNRNSLSAKFYHLFNDRPVIHTTL